MSQAIYSDDVRALVWALCLAAAISRGAASPEAATRVADAALALFAERFPERERGSA